MKFTAYLLNLSCLILILSCSNDPVYNNDDDSTLPPVLSDEVEVYEEGLMHNNLVLAVENGGEKAYIINKEGQKLFTWTFGDLLGNDFELLSDGNAIGIFKTDNPTIGFGGYGGIIKIIEPDGTIVWEYEYASETYISHHDVELLPNGNVLMLVWELIDVDESQQNGADTNRDLFPEKLIEVDPNTNTIVWEWRSWDHIIQDFDNTKDNYGNVSNNPQRINVNYAIPANGDLMHANGIDYDETKDIIYISVNNYSEVWVIDHSTTTSEAVGTTGGNYGKGGDLLYRFGNPTAYNNTFGNRLFYNNHFPNLIEDGEPGEGNIIIYMNGNNTEQSHVYEFEMPTEFSLLPNTNNEPTVVWDYTHASLYYARISGANRLSNGNTLICEGGYGYWEVTPNGKIAWKYNGKATSYWRGYPYDLDFEGLPFLGISF